MTAKVALVTCRDYPDLHPDDRLLLPPLRAAGFEPVAAIWDDPAVNWRDFTAAVVRSTWDYYVEIAAFRAWLRRMKAEGVRLLNPPDVVLGNLDKTYLRDLEARGVPTVPTVWVDPGDMPCLDTLAAGIPWEEVVIKPAVSAGAFRTARTTKAALLRDAGALREIVQDAAALIQPFLPEIVAHGEWSFLYFGDTFSHAVVKRPKAGDFRVQWRWGGTHVKEEPAPALRAQADEAFARLPGRRLYTRVDGVVSGGRLQVIEVELTEPYLFLGEHPGSERAFVEALTKLV